MSCGWIATEFDRRFIGVAAVVGVGFGAVGAERAHVNAGIGRAGVVVVAKGVVDAIAVAFGSEGATEVDFAFGACDVGRAGVADEAVAFLDDDGEWVDDVEWDRRVYHGSDQKQFIRASATIGYSIAVLIIRTADGSESVSTFSVISEFVLGLTHIVRRRRWQRAQKRCGTESWTQYAACIFNAGTVAGTVQVL